MLLGRLDRRAIHALSNGININPVVALRQPYRASDRKPAILFVGRLTRKADLDLLLHALRNPALAESCQPARKVDPLSACNIDPS